MKKVVIICIIAMLCVTSTSYADTALKKLARGMTNVVTCPAEICYGVSEAYKDNGILAAAGWGILSGMYRMGRRAVVGMYEVVTFPIPLPRYYKPILTDPEFVLEGWL